MAFADLGGGSSRSPACRGRKDLKITEMVCVSPEKRRKAWRRDAGAASLASSGQSAADADDGDGRDINYN
jgi:hypothetical protein